jgi:hypothetical protein
MRRAVVGPVQEEIIRGGYLAAAMDLRLIGEEVLTGGGTHLPVFMTLPQAN